MAGSRAVQSGQFHPEAPAKNAKLNLQTQSAAGFMRPKAPLQQKLQQHFTCAGFINRRNETKFFIVLRFDVTEVSPPLAKTVSLPILCDVILDGADRM